MSTYHNPLDIMPFPNENKSMNDEDGSAQKRKESFIDHLLKQYLSERKDSNELVVDDHVYGKIKRDIERLEHAVSSLEKKIGDAHYSDQRELKTNVNDMRDSFEKLQSELHKRVESYMGKVDELFQAKHIPIANNDQAQQLKGGLEKRVALLKHYEFENVKLKQLNMKLMRVECQKRIQRLSDSQPEVPSLSGEVDAPSKQKETHQLIVEIKKLEGKKTQLINDNIQLNQLSDEIVKENDRLKQELAKYHKHQDQSQ